MTRSTAIGLATVFLLLPLTAANAVEHRAEERRVGETSPSQSASTAIDCTVGTETPEAAKTGRTRHDPAAAESEDSTEACGAAVAVPDEPMKTGHDRHQ